MKILLFFTTAANHDSPNVHSYDWIDAADVAAAKLELRRKHNYQIKNICTEAEFND